MRASSERRTPQPETGNPSRPMKKYIIRRLISVIPVLWLVSVLVFSLIHLVPGDPVLVILGTTAEKAQVEAMRHKLGLDRPISGSSTEAGSGGLVRGRPRPLDHLRRAGHGYDPPADAHDPDRCRRRPPSLPFHIHSHGDSLQPAAQHLHGLYFHGPGDPRRFHAQLLAGAAFHPFFSVKLKLLAHDGLCFHLHRLLGGDQVPDPSGHVARLSSWRRWWPG